MVVPTFNDIPKFSGGPGENVEEWIQAIEAEVSEQSHLLAIDDNPRMTEDLLAIRLAHDNSTGEVKRKISQFRNEESDQAWSTLRTRLTELSRGT